jgi:DNA-binding Lrp family transcriptional regulator
MKLSEHERNILHIISLDTEISVPEIQRLTGYRSHAIRYYLSRVKDRNLIHFSPMINFSLLNLMCHSVYFSLSLAGEKNKAAILKRIAAVPNVTWLSEVGGKYQYRMCLLSRSLAQTKKTLDSFTEQHPGLFAKKSSSYLHSQVIFRPKSLGGIACQPEYIAWESASHPARVDEVDINILAGICQHNFSSIRELGRKVGVSSTTVNRRIHDLKQKGIICGFTFYLNYTALGLHKSRLLVSVRSNHRQFRECLAQFCRNHRGVESIASCCGSWDYEIRVVTNEMQACYDFCRELQLTFPDWIGSIVSLAEIREHKINSFPEEFSAHQASRLKTVSASFSVAA